MQQLTLDAVVQYHYPLTADERAFLFETWVQQPNGSMERDDAR